LFLCSAVSSPAVAIGSGFVHSAVGFDSAAIASSFAPPFVDTSAGLEHPMMAAATTAANAATRIGTDDAACAEIENARSSRAMNVAQKPSGFAR
jgi:hypothetical protein